MAPHAAGLVILHLPGHVVDFASAPTVLNLKTGWGNHIEGRHVVVGVATKAARNRNALILAEVKSRSHVVQRLGLEHKMIQPFGRIRSGVERDRMMSRVAMEKGQAESVSRRPLDLDEIADAHAEHVSVKRDASVKIIHCDHHVAEPLRARDESGNWAG